MFRLVHENACVGEGDGGGWRLGGGRREQKDAKIGDATTLAISSVYTFPV